MTPSLFQLLLCLALGIAAIILLTAKYRVHAFFALFIACFVVGLGLQFSVPDILTAMKDGFGNIMKSLGLIIVLGTALGILLEYTGSTRVMAAFILKKIGERRAPLAMSVTGFIVGLPLFSALPDSTPSGRDRRCRHPWRGLREIDFNGNHRRHSGFNGRLFLGKFRREKIADSSRG